MIYVLSDGWVTTMEAGALVACYFLYVLCMYFNQSLMAAIESCTNQAATSQSGEFDGKDGEEDDDDEAGPISKAVAAPLTILFENTIPDCTKEETKSRYLLTFFASIFWIA